MNFPLSLQIKKTLSKSISLQTDENDFEFLIIEHNNFDAAITLHGGHLLHFQLKNTPPVIWLSDDAIFDEQKAIRGGVPICWPWFGPAKKDLGDNLPAHGFARTSKWSIKSITELDNGVELELSLTDNEQTLKIWPYSFELVLKVTLTDTVKLELSSKNTGTKSFSYSAALHTYLTISSPEACQIVGLSQQYINKLNEQQIETGDTTLQIDRAIDSIYQNSNDTITLKDSKFKRNLNISNSGNDSAVIWSPWIEGAQNLNDMPDNGYKTMICIESSITNAQHVEAGHTHTLTSIIG